jgi:hypothetical protein
VVALARRTHALGLLGRIGLIASLAGGSLLFIAFSVQALFFAGDFPYMPLVVVPALVSLVIGMLALGVAILRAGVLPRAAGALLVIGAVVMLGFNDQNIQALMAVPFGVAWIVAGCALWARGSNGDS